MKGHTETRSRQVTGSNRNGEGQVPACENTPSCEATFYNEAPRGNSKFDDPGPDVLGQGPMEEAHSSKIR